VALILGIKGGKGLHNSSVALIDSNKDGIIFVGEEERFNGEKHTDCFPIASIDYIKNNLNVNLSDIEYVSIGNDDSLVLSEYWDFFNYYEKQGKHTFLSVKESCFNVSYNLSIIKKLIKQIFPNAYVFNVNHHDTHSALAFYCSNFNEAAIFTSDGLGEFESMTFSKGSSNKITRINFITYPDSLGFMYTLFCNSLGFFGPNPEGKVMALASFGKPKFLNSFKKIYKKSSPFSFSFNENYLIFNVNGGPPSFKNEKTYSELFNTKFRNKDEKINEIHYDIAASLQYFFEEVIISLTNDLYNETKLENICVGGGSFLNSVVNNKIIENTKFKNIYINPASHDGGNALGAALYTKHNILKSSKKTIFKNAYHGYDINVNISNKIFDLYKINYTIPENIFKEVAKLLNNGAIVGWSKGKAEIGPRALGNRSILASPIKKETVDYLNKEIKNREWFRPYAPIVMEEYAKLYFKLNENESPYMLKVYNILKDKIDKIKAISHIDGTSRIQTVNKEQNINMYNLLKEYKKLSGLPILLNTSFNIAGESIVNSEIESFLCFVFSKIDYLVLDKFLISKKDNIELIEEILKTYTIKEYFYKRKKRYVDKFRDFIINNGMIFSSSFSGVDKNNSIIFTENEANRK